MTVTRDVIYDLLPQYFAGQVSADTRTLVDEFFKVDPEFGRMAERFGSLMKDERAAGKAREPLALERTRRLVRYRNQLIGLAVGYSLLPFAFVIQDGGISFLFLERRPIIAVVFGLTGVCCWIAAAVMGWRSRHTGL